MPSGFERSGIEVVMQGAGKFVADMLRVNRVTQKNTQELAKTAKAMTQLGLRYDEAAKRFRGAGGLFQNTEVSLQRINARLDENAVRWEQFSRGVSASISLYNQKQRELQEETNRTEKLSRERLESLRSGVQQLLGGLSGGITIATAFFGAIVRGLRSLVGGLIERVTSALEKLVSPFRKMVEIAGGILIRDTFLAIGRQIQEMGSLAIGSAISLQNLTIQFEGLLARQFRAEDATLDVAASFELAADAAQGYLQWVKELALTAPFDAQDIVDTFVLGQAFGFTAQQAQSLTVAILTFASGMGLTNEQMARIIFNFGQMRAAGKVTGTELRDLARGSFVPTTQILRKMAEEIGVLDENFDQFLKGAKEGAVDVDAFFQSFIDTVGEDFPNAIERMSRTLQGVTVRARNFLKVIVGFEVLGPLMDSLAEVFANALDQLATPEVQRSAALLGLGLQEAFVRAHAAIQGVIGAFRSLADAIGITLPTINDVLGVISALTILFENAAGRIQEFVERVARDMGEDIRQTAANAFEWGFNIAVQIGTGIIEGAKNFIVAAMNFISNLLAFWLSPGSPPLVAPDIDLWGGAAFTEWLKGFALADFGVLNNIQNPLQSALSTLMQLDIIDATAATTLFSEISQGLASILAGDGGNIGNLFSDLIAQAGAFGVELQALTEAQFALLDITKQLEEAQEALNAAQLAQEQAISTVDKLVDEYNALLRAGADPAILEAKLAEINAAEEERDAAIETTKAAEEQVGALEDQIAPLEEAVRLQQELLNQMLEMARLQVQLQQGALGGAGAGGGDPFPFPGIDPSGFGIDPLGEGLQEEFDELFDSLGQTIIDKAAELFQPLVDAWDQAVADVTAAWEDLVGTFETNSNTTNSKLEQMRTTFQTAWTAITDIIRTAQESMRESFGEIGSDLDETGTKFDTFRFIVGFALIPVIGTVLILGAIVSGVASGIAEALDTILLAWDELREKWLEVNEILQSDTSTKWDKVKAIIGGVAKTIDTIIVTIFGGILEFIKGFIEGVIEFFQGLSDDLVGESIIPDMLEDISTAFEDAFADWLEDTGQWILDTIELFTGIDLETEGENLIQGFWDGAVTKLEEMFADVKAWVQSIIDLFNDVPKSESPSKITMESGRNLGKGFRLGLMETMGGVVDAAATMAANAVSAIGVVTSGTVAAAPVNVPSTTFNLNFGDVNNGADVAMIEGIVRRVILES